MANKFGLFLRNTHHCQKYKHQVMHRYSPTAICLTQGFIIVSKPAEKRTKLPCQSSRPASLFQLPIKPPASSLAVAPAQWACAAGLEHTSPPLLFSCFLKITSGESFVASGQGKRGSRGKLADCVCCVGP